MNVRDRIRIEFAVQRYDAWLELRGAARRRRKELRNELRSNLYEAAGDVGVTRALFGIGSPQQLAYATSELNLNRPRWSVGGLWAVGAFGVILYGLLFTAIAFTAGVEASGITGRQVTGSVFPWPGVEFTARIEPGRGGLAVGAAGIARYLLGIPLLTFVVAARPWRLLRRSRSAAPAAEGV